MILLFVLFFLLNVTSGEFIGNTKKDIDPQIYLFKYGYVSYDNFINSVPLNSSTLKQFQKFANLQQTGMIDSSTITKMMLPRCGMLDNLPKSSQVLKNRFTWNLLSHGQFISRLETLKVLRRAFRYWSNVNKILFYEIKNQTENKNVDIKISFKSKSHGDPYDFDGKGGTLAHAFYIDKKKNAQKSGDIHFDDAEEFRYNSKADRKYLLWLAVHEIGHSLGYGHTSITKSMMYPWYEENVHQRKSEVKKQRYPIDVTKTEPSPPPPTSTMFSEKEVPTTLIISGNPSRNTNNWTEQTVSPESKASDRSPKSKATSQELKVTSRESNTLSTKAKAVSNYKQKAALRILTRQAEEISSIYSSENYKMTFIFTKQENLYFLKTFINKTQSISKPTSRFFYLPSITGSIDAIFNVKLKQRNFQVIFSGKSFYVYRDFAASIFKKPGPYSIYGNNPFNLKLPRFVKEVDGAMTWIRNGKTYIFAGRFYWRFDCQKEMMDEGYPKLIVSKWKGLPNPIDAAHSSEHFQTTYFIVANKLYFFNDRTVEVESVHSTDEYFLRKGTIKSAILRPYPSKDGFMETSDNEP